MNGNDGKKKSRMSPELIGILLVGVALATMILTSTGRINDRIDRLDARLNTVEQNVAVLLERTKPLAPVTALAE